jgi:hypothetical protein
METTMSTKQHSVTGVLLRAHALLLKDLQALEQAAGAEGTADELCSCLDATRVHLARHFRFEEVNGYLEAVRLREPRLERAVAGAAVEHGQLAAELDRLIAAARSGADPQPLREQVRGWLGRVREHEARENDLVQEAFGLDLGADD